MKNFSLFLVLLLSVVLISPPKSNAQWVQTNELLGAEINCFAVSGENLFAGTYKGVFLSTNNGTSWTEVSSGLTNISVLSLAVSGTDLFVFTGSGVFVRPLLELITSGEQSSTQLPEKKIQLKQALQLKVVLHLCNALG